MRMGAINRRATDAGNLEERLRFHGSTSFEVKEQTFDRTLRSDCAANARGANDKHDSASVPGIQMAERFNFDDASGARTLTRGAQSLKQQRKGHDDTQTTT